MSRTPILHPLQPVVPGQEPKWLETRRVDHHCAFANAHSSRLDLTADTAYQGPRKLLKEGPVTKSKSGRKLTLVLCNDILVLIDSRNLYRMVSLFHLPLPRCLRGAQNHQ